MIGPTYDWPTITRTAFFGGIMDPACDLYLKPEGDIIQAHDFKCVCEIKRASSLNSRSSFTIGERHPQLN